MLAITEDNLITPVPSSSQVVFDEEKLLIYRELYYDGFSSIIAARDLTTGAAVAVKKIEFRFLKPAPFPLENLKERYARKINQQAAKIRALTPNSVVKMMEFAIESNRVTIMTEMCMFGDLFNWMLQQPQLRIRDICLVVQNIFQALRFLHSQNYVHGALSPTTILFQSMSPQSVTIMPDCSVRSEVLQLVRIEPPIMDCFSPEQLKAIVSEQQAANSFVPTEASDVWSVGIIAHIAFTGKAPFRGTNASELLATIERADGKTSNKIFSTLSSLIQKQIHNALSVDPGSRTTADEGSEVFWFDDEHTKNDNRNILLTIEYELLNTCRRYRNQGRQVFERVFRHATTTVSQKLATHCNILPES
ncbi:unnamed protein product [Echinostoma caproni]|uniref:Protein kinase domain-containing protein n=1 Tax=Echinostoma caproni TaxID=27848 RepID=A0A183B6C4_9TREM|nr:unnamed protein product [Echinostoma caproni]